MTATAEGTSDRAAVYSGTLDATLRELGLRNSGAQQLAAMVSARLGASAEILSARVDSYPYDLPAVNTRDRFEV